uniref:Bifunctional protein GlmU-like isoform X1 n=2 Tax=Petromyzon marinus TaxID=7757 RepID=A0AAJ7U5E8_PETMA|nr:bifunctional protein GlmU-like isoform X1 [Petromyzon marinus]
MSSALSVWALRVGPGEDAMAALRLLVARRGLRAPFLLAAVGSVTGATLRLPGPAARSPEEVAELADPASWSLLPLEGPLEIVSLVGTLNPEAHVHAALSDARGRVWGGHVLGELRVHTTAEIVVGEAAGLAFSRAHDPTTGFPELCVGSRGERETDTP